MKKNLHTRLELTTRVFKNSAVSTELQRHILELE